MQGDSMTERVEKLSQNWQDMAWHGPGFTRATVTHNDNYQVRPQVPFITGLEGNVNLMFGLRDDAGNYAYQAATGDEITFTGEILSGRGGNNTTLPSGAQISIFIGGGDVTPGWQAGFDIGDDTTELATMYVNPGEPRDFSLTATVDELPAGEPNLFVGIAANGGNWDELGVWDAQVTVTGEPEPEPEPEPEEPEPEEPGPEEPEPSTEHHKALAERVAKLLDLEGDPQTIALATHHVEIIESYVYGYTRGNGFSATGEPNRQLSNVIVAATAKLTYNPEQVTYYQAGDYSERPQYLTGWTLMEQAVLNNYRKRWA